ncbi:16S rRNA (guanine(966)-N(2))-methyltransferase RsmD [Vallicoccus soli]|uniref:16S rRNA (Guanine(966)-N(2))-methyltransferase RsmD n=1 Tax=Vallicoccus soli TaxID=2339232 RepID=A0A3A3Z5J8_9ACTN|nr:16S rRNA (guanine(966)-N(2))-methyltransferase RsmD [Vallicoccus soli]RJK98243.1 16S rRNA (guanine(966)-N(2))-methyltransferase RsmD [Vallicoccus soli]
MSRIVGGAAGGRRLAVPPRGTRPTSDRAREALASALEALLGGPGALAGARVLDLYAGSGALGLEALSRGAAAVDLVESDARAARVLRANVRAVALPGAQVLERRVEDVLAGPPPGPPYDAVLADPPYALGEDALAAVLARLADGWIAPGAVLVVERSSRGPAVPWPPGVEGLRSRRYGEAALWYGRAAPPPTAQP